MDETGTSGKLVPKMVEFSGSARFVHPIGLKVNERGASKLLLSTRDPNFREKFNAKAKFFSKKNA